MAAREDLGPDEPRPSLNTAPLRHARAMRQRAEDLAMLARFTRDVPRFLGATVGLAEATGQLRRRLETREQRFLAVVDRAIYGRPSSPYARLLRNAGCEPGDLRAMVAQEGIEGALRRLRDRGVYVTLDEFKGRRAAVRGSASFSFRERDFDNPLLAPHFFSYTGGTRGRPSRVDQSLALVHEIASVTAVAFGAHGLRDPGHVFWITLPLHWMLVFAKLGQPTVGWFYPVAPLSRRVRLGARYLAACGRLAGRTFPHPTYRGVEQPEAIAAWLARRAGGARPLVVTAPASAAARVASAALARGLDLGGTTFIAMSEPITPARRRQIEAAGATMIARYATMEAATIGFSCADPDRADDVHLFHDRYALIERSREVVVGGPSVDALLLSSVSPTSSKIFFNAEPGDYARIAERDCGCELGRLGLRTHLSEIRSFEKLTGGGVTFARSNILHILEEVLPARFGGTGLEYQLLEEEAGDGTARLVLRVHPSVGPLDQAALRATLLEELGRGDVVNQHQAELLRRAGSVAVVRRPPLATRAGKVLPFHLMRAVAGAPTPRATVQPNG